MELYNKIRGIRNYSKYWDYLKQGLLFFYESLLILMIAFYDAPRGRRREEEDEKEMRYSSYLRYIRSSKNTLVLNTYLLHGKKWFCYGNKIRDNK